MRTLRFIVKGQIMEPDPNCNFDGLVPGTDGYLQAEFSFSHEWDRCVKVAAFYSVLGIEYRPQPLTNGNKCVIPAEALKNRVFKVKVLGRGRNGENLITNKVEVCQRGDKK